MIPGIQGVVYGLAIILVILLAPEGVFWRVRDQLVRGGRIRSFGSAAAPAPVSSVAAPAFTLRQSRGRSSR